MENNPQNQPILELLKKQNQMLASIHEILLKHELRARNTAIIRFILTAIPYIALVIIVWLLYRSIQGYLDTLNNNINSLHQGFLHLEDSIGKLIPDFSSIKNGLESTWQSTKNLFN